MRRILILVSLALFFCGSASAQIYRVAELNTEQIRALDRQKTVVLLPGGVLEQHGPYLPSFTDGYMNEWWTQELAEEIAARPGWSVLVFPIIPLGDGGANEIGGKYVFPGTYGVRVQTLRAVFMDLATELGEQGFRWIFVIHNHGSPLHNQALDQAGDYFRDVYGGRMVNLFGLLPKPSRPEPTVSSAESKENGIDIHAGMSETSRMLFLRRDLVDPARITAKPFAAATGSDFLRIAKADDWPGYFGSPRLASAAFGAQVMRYRAARYNALALAILDGMNDREIPRYADEALREEADTVAGGLRYDAEVERKQQEWLRKRGIK
jgi:creatinine amidohydrolase/Fe(II)-dependent formamide hydrolase-like protein